jgi:hypothetical protein
LRTGRDFFTLLSQKIKSDIQATVTSVPGQPGSGVGVAGTSDEHIAEILRTLEKHQDTIDGILLTISSSKGQIITGGDITATNPPTSKVYVDAVQAFCPGAGTIYSLTSPVTPEIINSAKITKPGTAFILLTSNGTIEVSSGQDPSKVTLGKVIIPSSDSYRVTNDKEGENDAYIVSRKDLFFEEDFKLDDESISELRGIMDKLLADNLIGNIRLSENLTITNSDGSLEMNSSSLKMSYPNSKIGMLLDRDGVRFYDNNGALICYFTKDGAKVAALKVTPTGIESTNYKTGESGFWIGANGNCEFFNGVFRGTITAVAGTIGGWIIEENYLHNSDNNVFLDALLGEIRLKNNIDYKMSINSSGLFLEGYRILTLDNFVPDQQDYIKDIVMRGASTLQVIDSIKYLYGAKSGQFAIPASHVGDSDYLDNDYTVLLDYTANSSGITYTGECYIFSLVRSTAALITLDSTLDAQYVRNLIVGTADIEDLSVTDAKVLNLNGNKITAKTINADKIDVNQLSAIAIDGGCIVAGVLQNHPTAPTSFFNLNTGKLGIRTTDSNSDHILVVGDTSPGSCQYMVYDTSTGRLTVRDSDYVRNVLDFPDPVYGPYSSGALALALADLPNSGGKIYMPPGTYTFNVSVTVSKSNVTIEGAGYSTIINATANNAFYISGASGVTIRNMSINVRDNNLTSIGFYSPLSDFLIEECFLGNLLGYANCYGLNLQGDISVKRCRFEGGYYGCWAVKISGGSSNHSIIDDCRFINCYRGIYCYQGIHITNNLFYNTADESILIDAYTGNGADITIIANRFDTRTVSGSGNYAIVTSANPPSYVPINISIMNNQIYNKALAINLLGSSGGRVVGNHIQSTNGHALYCDGGFDNIFADNVCYGGGSGYGIAFVNAAYQNLIHGNRATGGFGGIYTTGSVTVVDNI